MAVLVRASDVRVSRRGTHFGVGTASPPARRYLPLPNKTSEILLKGDDGVNWKGRVPTDSQPHIVLEAGLVPAPDLTKYRRRAAISYIFATRESYASINIA